MPAAGLPSSHGNMPAVQERPRHTRGATIASSNANYNWDGGANDGNDFKQTRDVGQYAASPWGFFDMHGNVWEWTADWYRAAYPTGPVVDPTGPASGSLPGQAGWFLDPRDEPAFS